MSRGKGRSVDLLETQVLVIGTGAGGATTAAALVEAGFEVLMVEEGPGVDTASIPSNSPKAITSLYRHAGLTPILGNQNIAFVEGCCVGGSTEINSGFWHRLSPETYPRWKADALLDAFTPEIMEGYFERIESDLSVSFLGRERENKSSAVLRRGAERMHWRCAEVPRCQRDPGASAFAPGAKQSMQRTYIPRALRAGARLRADCRVLRIEHENGVASGARVSMRTESRRVEGTIRADTIFVCAGAVQTPALLRRSGIRRNVGNTLCLHPMIKAAALFDEEIDAGQAALPMYQVNEFWPTLTLGGSVYSPGFLAMLLADNWEANRDLIRCYDRMGLFYAATRGMNRGRVRVVPGFEDGTIIRYRLSKADCRNLSLGLARLAELLFAAGARSVHPSLRGFPALTSVDAARGFLKQPLPASVMNLSTVHVFSSCPMGENVDFCATDSFGKVNGCSNLFVNDASLLPDSPGVNPQGITMAIASRNAEHFVERVRRGPRVLRSAASTPARKADVLVTGAPGWLGTRLVQVLADETLRRRCGIEKDVTAKTVRCLVRPNIDPAPLAGSTDTVEVCYGDLGDDQALERFCNHSEGATLFHVAGVVHPAWRTSDFQRVNVEGTRRLLEAAQAGGVRRVVVVSSNSPMGCNPHVDQLFDENSPYHPYMGYGRSKAQMERLVHETHAAGRIETVIVRPPWFYGPHQPPRQTQFFRLIRQGRFPVLGSGLQKRSMAYVDNICQGLLLAATVERANGHTYWIADERPYTIEEVVETVRDLLESRFGIPCQQRSLRLPSWVGGAARLADATLQGIGLYQQQIHVLGEMNQTIACSIEKARTELGYAPRYSLRDGMAASIQWCLENGYYI